jgi:hypothetical protein
MTPEATVLARSEQLGCVTRCPHGCIHIQVGHASWTFTEDQYVRFVALLTDSAAAYEELRGDYGESGAQGME